MNQLSNQPFEITSKYLSHGWYEGTIKITETFSYWWQAKVYGEGSRYGINKGRVSKLCICSGDHYNSNKQVYGYDRGLDFDNCPPHVLQAIVEHCESLPLIDV